ncbi:MAG TPA: DUF262 domain-containing protein [Leptolyngbyaceae cyanobacterium]
MGFSFMVSDAEIETKYESSKNKLLQQHERIKLPRLAENIRFNPNYIMIDPEESSSWDTVKQSRLIESLIINIPVPPIVLYSLRYGSHVVIDGKERLRAIADFYSNKLALTGLEVKPELDGCTYVTLPVFFKTLLDRKSLTFITIIPDSSFSPGEIAKLINIVAKRLKNKRGA